MDCARNGAKPAENLGATYLPVLDASGLADFAAFASGSMILLFGNSFGAYATALSLTGGFINLVTIVIGSQIKGDILHNPGLGMPWHLAWSL